MRMTVKELASRVGLSVTPNWNRLKDLKCQGIISQYTAVLDRHPLGLGTLVLAEMNLSSHSESVMEEFENAVRACPLIIECQSTMGNADYLIKATTPTVKDYDAFLHDVVFKLTSGAVRLLLLRALSQDWL